MQVRFFGKGHVFVFVRYDEDLLNVQVVKRNTIRWNNS